MTDDKIYIEAWVEEGWDELNKCAGKDYKYYTKIIVKDYEGIKFLKRLDQFIRLLMEHIGFHKNVLNIIK